MYEIDILSHNTFLNGIHSRCYINAISRSIENCLGFTQYTPERILQDIKNYPRHKITEPQLLEDYDIIVNDTCEDLTNSIGIIIREIYNMKLVVITDNTDFSQIQGHNIVPVFWRHNHVYAMRPGIFIKFKYALYNEQNKVNIELSNIALSNIDIKKPVSEYLHVAVAQITNHLSKGKYFLNAFKKYIINDSTDVDLATIFVFRPAFLLLYKHMLKFNKSNIKRKFDDGTVVVLNKDILNEHFRLYTNAIYEVDNDNRMLGI